jgi:hypothetical protein
VVGGGLYWSATDVLVPCLACHQEHPDAATTLVNARSNNLFQLRSYPLDEDGDPIPASQEGNPFEVTTLTARRSDATQGYFWCNTCHSGSMGSGKLTCFSCHAHGDSRF